MIVKPSTSINDYLIDNGYLPVEHDATIHECYVCILHFNRFETILGNIDGRRSAIIRAIVEGEDSPGVTERTVNDWVKTAYGKEVVR